MLKFYFFSLLVLLLLENFTFLNIKIYIFYIFIVFILLFKKISFKKLHNYEFFFLILYFYLALTSIFANDLILAIRLVAYELILLLTYFTLRYLSYHIKLEEFINALVKIGKYYILISLFYYLLGVIYSHTINGTGNEQFLYGIMKEWNLIRFRGLEQSPNSYILFGTFFLYLFLYQKKYIFAFITLLTILATISTTIIIILFLVVLLYYITKKQFIKLLSLLLLITALSTSIYFFFIEKNHNLLQLLKWRMNRNSSGSGRFELWSYIWTHKIPEHPLFGYGINQTRDIIADFHKLHSVHNSFLEILITSGFVGLLLYSCFIFCLFIISIKLSRNYSTTFFTNLFLTFTIASFSNNTLHIVYLIFYLLVLHVFLINKLTLNHSS